MNIDQKINKIFLKGMKCPAASPFAKSGPSVSDLENLFDCNFKVTFPCRTLKLSLIE